MSKELRRDIAAQRNAARVAIYGGEPIETGNEELRRYLAHFSLSQTDMGRILRVSPRAVHMWANDKEDIPDPVLMLLRLQFKLVQAEGWMLARSKYDAKKRLAHLQLYKDLQRKGKIPPGQGVHAQRMAAFAVAAARDRDPAAREAVATQGRNEALRDGGEPLLDVEDAVRDDVDEPPGVDDL